MFEILSVENKGTYLHLVFKNNDPGMAFHNKAIVFYDLNGHAASYMRPNH